MISPETIALVRERTDILAVIGESVPSLKRRGRSFVGLCPFHKEKTPSFHVNPDRGFFHCFGCKESGSAIDFLIKHEGYTFPEAVRALAERAGITIEETKSPALLSEADRHRKQRDELYAVNALAATYFEQQLRSHEQRAAALEELERRGLPFGKDAKIDEALQAFRIGYAPSGWDGLASFLRAQGVSPMAAETVGLLVPRSSGAGHYDRFRHRLMFAVLDPQGRVVAFSGRALAGGPVEANARNADPPPKYVNSPESPIYTKGQMLFGIHQARHTIRQEESAVVVEGNFDVVALHARGLTNVVAPLGTAFTVEQAKLLKRFASSVVFLFDGDAAGRKAVRLSRDPARAAGLSARVAELPNGVDPDEFARERGVKAVEDLVASAKGMLEACIAMALDEEFAQADAHERQARIGYVAKLIADEDDPVVQMMLKGFTDMIAGRLDLVRAGPGAFGALERKVKDAVSRAEAERRQEQERRRAAQAAARASAPPPKDLGFDPRDDHDRRETRAAYDPHDDGFDRDGSGRGYGGGGYDRERGRRDTASVPSRIAPRPPGSEERKAILGILIEWPVLLDDSEVAAQLSVLEGASVTVIAALRRAWNGATKTLDTDGFLAQIPPVVRPFASQHLAGPTTESEAEAKGYLLRGVDKLKRLLLSQEAAQFTRETYRAEGDWEAGRELLRETADRLRAKQGLKT